MNVIVTGGAGFIGSHVVNRLLEEGHGVTVIDDFNDYYNPEIKRGNVAAYGGEVRVVEGDIRDRELVRSVFAEAKADAVIHLAARAGVRPSIQDPVLYVDTNINGTMNLLEAAREFGVTEMVFASSSSVYGENKKVPFAEDDLLEGVVSPYAATKLSGEHLCSNYAKHFGVNIRSLRFFTVYGPGQRPDLAISKFVRLVESGQPIERYGDGSTGRDYTYISDIVDGVMAALAYRETPFEIFNLGGSNSVSLGRLIEIVEEATGKKAEVIELPDQPGDVPFTAADVSKSGRLLGYSPKVRIEDGVKRYVEWFRSTEAARS
ncbi:MAG: SDR family NAD(P)-dependent oxidoreductase [Verrucomicrobiales bacterium]|nr:SDR family NAD(P)-dependent oxidoreductase [Verrucomicrobiales bacterium]